jgi:hypothetical protein
VFAVHIICVNLGRESYAVSKHARSRTIRTNSKIVFLHHRLNSFCPERLSQPVHRMGYSTTESSVRTFDLTQRHNVRLLNLIAVGHSLTALLTSGIAAAEVGGGNDSAAAAATRASPEQLVSQYHHTKRELCLASMVRSANPRLWTTKTLTRLKMRTKGVGHRDCAGSRLDIPGCLCP